MMTITNTCPYSLFPTQVTATLRYIFLVGFHTALSPVLQGGVE